MTECEAATACLGVAALEVIARLIELLAAKGLLSAAEIMELAEAAERRE